MKNTSKDNNGISYIFSRGLFVILIGLIFDLTAFPSLLIKSNFWAILFSILIMLPFLYVIFIIGKITGEHCFKANRKNSLKIQQGETVTRSQRFLEYHWAKGFLFCALYPLWQIILLVLGIILKNSILTGIVNLYNMSFMSILSVAGLYKPGADLFDLLFLIIILIVPIIFEAGYIIAAEKLKRQHREIAQEIKLFNS